MFYGCTYYLPVNMHSFLVSIIFLLLSILSTDLRYRPSNARISTPAMYDRDATNVRFDDMDFLTPADPAFLPRLVQDILQLPALQQNQTTVHARQTSASNDEDNHAPPTRDLDWLMSTCSGPSVIHNQRNSPLPYYDSTANYPKIAKQNLAHTTCREGSRALQLHCTWAPRPANFKDDHIEVYRNITTWVKRLLAACDAALLDCPNPHTLQDHNIDICDWTYHQHHYLHKTHGHLQTWQPDHAEACMWRLVQRIGIAHESPLGLRQPTEMVQFQRPDYSLTCSQRVEACVWALERYSVVKYAVLSWVGIDDFIGNPRVFAGNQRYFLDVRPFPTVDEARQEVHHSATEQLQLVENGNVQRPVMVNEVSPAAGSKRSAEESGAGSAPKFRKVDYGAAVEQAAPSSEQLASPGQREPAS